MDIVEHLRKHQCPENKGCNPVVEYCQCALMDSGADEIERLRETVSMLAGDRDLYIEEIKRKNAEIERLREDLWKIMMAYPEESYAHVIAKSALQQKDTK